MKNKAVAVSNSIQAQVAGMNRVLDLHPAMPSDVPNAKKFHKGINLLNY